MHQSRLTPSAKIYDLVPVASELGDFGCLCPGILHWYFLNS